MRRGTNTTLSQNEDCELNSGRLLIKVHKWIPRTIRQLIHNKSHLEKNNQLIMCKIIANYFVVTSRSYHDDSGQGMHVMIHLSS
jgi:hypothetical protein